MTGSNRSLERGTEILRAFRPGSEALGNGEIAERTGIPRSTVSRLTQTLVASGFLHHDTQARVYFLGAPVLSLGHALRSGSPVLKAAADPMRQLAQRQRLNVGLALPDGDEMVYLESIRYNKAASLRSVVAGQRVPIELTSLGRAYLAVLPAEELETLMHRFRKRRPANWSRLKREILESIESVRTRRFCVATWQPEVVALATPLVLRHAPIHVLNVSVSTTDPLKVTVQTLGPALLALADKIQHALDQ